MNTATSLNSSFTETLARGCLQLPQKLWANNFYIIALDEKKYELHFSLPCIKTAYDVAKLALEILLFPITVVLIGMGILLLSTAKVTPPAKPIVTGAPFSPPLAIAVEEAGEKTSLPLKLPSFGKTADEEAIAFGKNRKTACLELVQTTQAAIVALPSEAIVLIASFLSELQQIHTALSQEDPDYSTLMIKFVEVMKALIAKLPEKFKDQELQNTLTTLIEVFKEDSVFHSYAKNPLQEHLHTVTSLLVSCPIDAALQKVQTLLSSKGDPRSFLIEAILCLQECKEEPHVALKKAMQQTLYELVDLSLHRLEQEGTKLAASPFHKVENNRLQVMAILNSVVEGNSGLKNESYWAFQRSFTLLNSYKQLAQVQRFKTHLDNAKTAFTHLKEKLISPGVTFFQDKYKILALQKLDESIDLLSTLFGQISSEKATSISEDLKVRFESFKKAFATEKSKTSSEGNLELATFIAGFDSLTSLFAADNVQPTLLLLYLQTHLGMYLENQEKIIRDVPIRAALQKQLEEMIQMLKK